MWLRHTIFRQEMLRDFDGIVSNGLTKHLQRQSSSSALREALDPCLSPSAFSMIHIGGQLRGTVRWARLEINTPRPL